MRIENYIDLRGIPGISGLFFACGSFGTVDGDAQYSVSESDGIKTYTHTGKDVTLCASFEQKADGVVIRRDYLTNNSDHAIELYTLVSRFRLTGNEYDVYTQYNGWQHESSGGWQKLVTQVCAASLGTRTCESAAPVMALHDRLNGRNTVFHLLPNAKWSMTAKKVADSMKELVVIETGFDPTAMHLRVEAGERIDLPTVIFFNAESQTDLDAYKLHSVYNELYPRRRLPIQYNSWLYCFDAVNIDNLLRQADCAAELGFEAFMVDAGWFGTGELNWWDSAGDWTENTVKGPCGRLSELSERVREHGMIFGLWFEPERGSPKSQAVREHPDYYIDGKLLDFSNPDAVDYIFDVICGQIDKYHIGWVKFDFNTSVPTDPAGDCFYRYLKGQRSFVKRLRAKYPELYITNCASGGYRMELYQASFCDSFWLSDNQGPYGGVTIVKDTLKRMPTSLIERWNVQKYYVPNNGTKQIMFSCNNATWDFILNVDDSYTKAFMSGGPVGFTCDVASFPDEYKESWKQFIAAYKDDRSFYMKAAARILTDTELITVIEYFDRECERCEIQVFTKVTYANDITVYPKVDKNARYEFNGEVLEGCDIAENGIVIGELKHNCCRVLDLRKV